MIRVDPEDQWILEKFTWYQNPHGYAGRPVSGTTQYLHHFICELYGIIIPEDFLVDHIDGCPINNTKRNLRLVTYSVNGLNRQKSPGIGLHRGKWRARLMVGYKDIFLGYFISKPEAILAWRKAICKHRSIALDSSNYLLRKALLEIRQDPEKPFIFFNQEELVFQDSVKIES